MTTVLGFETSCDETGIGIVRDGVLLADALATSIEEHARFGGVPVLVGPELAAQLKTIRRTQPSPEHGSRQ